MFSQEQFKKVFKAYDIRGIYPTDIDEELFYQFGKAFVEVVGVKQIAVGRDMRLSSNSLFEALTRGLTEQGAQVIDLGQITTDMIYFACGHYEYEAGIMITASHNPKEYNGMKACLKHAAPLPSKQGKEYEKIQELLLSRHEFTPAPEAGNVTQKNITKEWIEHLHTFFDSSKIPAMNIVVDTGNGMAGPFVQALFETLPQITLTPLYFEPDGNFPHHPASPIEEENLIDLKAKMKEVHADLGMAFDGDGDRVFLVDDQGRTLSGTEATAMVGEMMLQKYPGGTVLYNAICGKIVPETVNALGGTPMRVRVGHTFIKQAMQEVGGIFAGEHSGHYFFKDNWNADSGIIMAVILLEMIAKEGQKLSELRRRFDKYAANEEQNFQIQDIPAMLNKLEQHFHDHEMDHLDGLTIYGEDWWANIRPSNTEPLLRLNIEASNHEHLREKTQEFHALLSE